MWDYLSRISLIIIIFRVMESDRSLSHISKEEGEGGLEFNFSGKNDNDRGEKVNIINDDHSLSDIKPDVEPPAPEEGPGVLETMEEQIRDMLEYLIEEKKKLSSMLLGEPVQDSIDGRMTTVADIYLEKGEEEAAPTKEREGH